MIHIEITKVDIVDRDGELQQIIIEKINSTETAEHLDEEWTGNFDESFKIDEKTVLKIEGILAIHGETVKYSNDIEPEFIETGRGCNIESAYLMIDGSPMNFKYEAGCPATEYSSTEFERLIEDWIQK